MSNNLQELAQLRDYAYALRERVRVLEAEVAQRDPIRSELNHLYDAQSAYLDRHLTSWCATPFAARIAELEAQLGL